MSTSWRKLLALLSALALLLSLLGLAYHRRQWKELERLELLAQTQPEKALKALEQTSVLSSLESRADKLRLLCLTDLERGEDLLWLYELKPQLFLEAQRSRLLVGQTLLKLGRQEDLEQLLERNPDFDSQAAWFLLKTDLLLMRGESTAAVSRLLARRFSGQAESERLLRLAVLAKDIQTRWQLLQEATSLAPRNAKAYRLRGRHFESLGLYSQALTEYNKVRVLDPQNPKHSLRLGFFHLRHRNYDLALAVWKELGSERAPTPLINFLEFVTRGRPLDSDMPSVELLEPWLKLLQCLEEGDLQGADLCLSGSEQAYRFEPLLAWGVEQLLYHQGVRSWRHERPTPPPLENHHRFFQELRSPQTLGPISDSVHAYSALFLAGGWLHTGLRLPHPDLVPESYPDWYAFALGQAYRVHRSASETRAFLGRNIDRSGCRLLLAEQMISEGKNEEALQALEPLLSGHSAESFRAAWLSTTVHLENRRPEKALGVLRSCSSFREHTLGQELESRIHLLRGDRKKAGERYLSISDESLEAQVYLASQALADRDFPQARHYTLQALQNAPEAPELRRNLLLIQSLEEKR